MSILNFQKPDEIKLLKDTEPNTGLFEYKPLEPGFGLTIGNSLRRVLLSSLEGYAFTSIKINGVDHEFSSIDGVIQDVTDIILNLKEVCLKPKDSTNDITEETITMKVEQTELFTAKDIGKNLTFFDVINEDKVICEMNTEASFELQLTIHQGRGYQSADENKGRLGTTPLGTIVIDSIYTPIENVNYKVEDFRVEQRTDYEKLLIEVKTNGTISPRDALSQAARILMLHFKPFSEDKMNLEENAIEKEFTYDEQMLKMRRLLNTKLVDMNVSVRALNCLKSAEVETVGQLVRYNKNDLMKFRNFGKKSLTELENLLTDHELYFGMDTTEYQLDDSE